MVKQGQNTSRKHYSSFTMNMLFVMFAICGLALIPKLTVKLNPGREPDALTVSFSYPGAAPQVVEHEVTSVLEGAIATMGGVRRIESNSSFGYGNIIIEVEDDNNLQTIRFEILSILKDVWQHLPARVGYPEISTGREEAGNKELLFSYTLIGDVTSFELKEYADNTIKKALSKIKGISVETYGATPHEWKFSYNNELLDQYGLSPTDLAQSLNLWQQKTGIGTSGENFSANSLPATPVILSYADQTALIHSWKNIPVTTNGRKIIHLGDVAQLEIKEQQPTSYFRINGKNTVSVNIYASPSSNQLDVAKDVEKAEQNINASLPDEWQLIQMYNSSDYLRNEINKTTLRLAASIIIILILLFLIQRNLRYLLLIITSLIINISISFVFYYLFDVEIHLVSIAGITVSIGIIIGNFIYMADYLLTGKSRHIFMAMCGATIATMGALVVVFLVDDTARINLIDFALITMINLSVSLLIALFLVPSLVNGMNFKRIKKHTREKQLRRIALFTSGYYSYIKFACRWRPVFIIVLILLVGLPINLLPVSLNKDTAMAKVYNNTFGSNFYREYLRMPIETITGGMLRLFMQHVSDRNSYYQPSGETSLYMRVSLPTGTTIMQLNDVCVKMENFLIGIKGIRQFQTYVNSPQDASIIVYFTKEAQNSAIPSMVKGFLIQKANEFAGADFGIYMRNESFSNELSEGWRSSQIQLSGYDYRQLVALARSYSDTLRLNPRIEDIAIFSGNDIFLMEATVDEKGMLLSKNLLAGAGIGYNDYVNALQNYNAGATAQTIVIGEDSYIPVSFSASDLNTLDFWQFMHTAIGNDSVKLRPSEVSQLTTMHVDGNIYKENQSYIIRLAYNFIGPDGLAKKVLEREANKLRQKLPLGFKAEIPEYNYAWMFGNKPMQYWLIGLSILIIWIISAILFNSLLQPFLVICMIPLAFTGAFIAFYYFEIPFDPGGFAALILLSGLSANMAIYLLSDFNQLEKQNKLPSGKNYLKAHNSIITPMLLTTLSIIAGLLPFLIFDTFTSFWTAFAAGTIGGLLLSIPLMVLFFPLVMNLKVNERSNFTKKNPIKL